jgi:hypothetical protein
MARKYTVLWGLHPDYIATRITMGSEIDPATLSHDDWLVKALVRYRKDCNMSPWSRMQARSYIEDTAPSLAAVVRGHHSLVVEP